MRKLFSTLADAAVVALAAVALWSFFRGTAPSRAPTPSAALAAPNVALVDSTPKRFELLGVAGPRQVPENSRKATLLYFFNTRCPGCLQQKPGWLAVAAVARSSGIVVYGVTGEDIAQPTVRNYFTTAAIDVAQARDAEAIGRLLSVDAVPSTVLLDGAGLIRFHHQGVLAPAKDSLLRRLLAQEFGGAP